MRSVSLEFTPDGTHDVRVRLAERAGDVHISLHSTDASLAGRVREGGISVPDANTVKVVFGGVLNEPMEVVIIG